MDNVVETRPPAVDGACFEPVLSRVYAPGEYTFLKTLPSYGDRNYLFEHRCLQNEYEDRNRKLAGQDESERRTTKRKVTLKVVNSDEPLELIAAQTEAILFCEAEECPTHRGCNMWHAAGRSSGLVSKALRSFYAKKLESGGCPFWRTLNADSEWNLNNLEAVISKYCSRMTDERKKRFVGQRLAKRKHGSAGRRVQQNNLRDAHQDAEGNMKSEDVLFPLRQTLVHGDPNDHNLIYQADRNRVILLDFGDLMVSYDFADAAIGSAYAPSAECAESFVDGWLDTCGIRGGWGDVDDDDNDARLHRHLLENLAADQTAMLQRDAIFEFATMRRLTSVCISNYQLQLGHDDPYLQCSTEQMWRELGWTSEKGKLEEDAEGRGGGSFEVVEK
eukprot:g4375.t1